MENRKEKMKTKKKNNKIKTTENVPMGKEYNSVERNVTFKSY